jgi:hypothetical protein
MKLRLSLCLTVAALARSAAAHEAEFKSPGPGMHFTVGQAVIVFADLGDSNNNHGFIINGVGWPQLQVLVDSMLQIDSVTGSNTVPGTNMVDENGNPEPADFYRFSVVGLTVGTHQVVVRGKFPPPPFSNGATQDSAPIAITIDPLPAGRTLLSLNANVTGSVNWNNVNVVGNGHTVAASGSLVITNSLVTGLGSMTIDGITGTVASVDIENSVFEATGGLTLRTTSTAVVRNNEFRANNLLTFESSQPDASPIFTMHGATAALKLFQGNRIGAGRVVFDGVSNWLVGGDTDNETNILMGPRCTTHFVNGVSNITMRGNYTHHNYRGGWSQGFNVDFVCNFCGPASGTNVLVEHNFIRGGSWPVQSLIGEFRYNVVYGYGHTWIRSAEPGASIHHNLFAPEGGGGLNDGISLTGGETGVRIYNNTFDGGGNATGDFAGPTVGADSSARIDSLRNNLVTFSRNYENSAGEPRIVGEAGNVVSADYNAFYSPDNTTHDNYHIAGLTEGVSPGFATHDVSGSGALGVTDGQLAVTPFAGARIFPLETVIDEGAVWQRTQKLSAVLAAFRARYTPKPGNPVIDRADPQDNDAHGRRADIGAIDRDGHDQDRLGKFGEPTPVELLGFDIR